MLCLVWGDVFGEPSTCFKPLNRSLFLFLHKRRTHFLSKTNTLPNIQRSISGRGSHTFFLSFFFDSFKMSQLFTPTIKNENTFNQKFFRSQKGFNATFTRKTKNGFFTSKSGFHAHFLCKSPTKGPEG